MRLHVSVLLVLIGSLLLGLPGCAGDSMKSSQPTAEDGNTPAVAQGEGAQGKSPSGEIQERAVPRMLPGTGPVITQPQMPPPTSGPSAGRLRGMAGAQAPPATTFAPPPLYQGPTPNITTVANALAQYHKSLTTLTTVKPGLVLTQPVTISIAYLSPAGYGPGSPERLTQSYAPATGNHFLRNDNAGNGQPRPVHLDINLSEPKPGGGLYSYNVPVDLVLDPLFDVTLGSLIFTLTTPCDVIGDTTIGFFWLSPDGQRHDSKFNTSPGQHPTVDSFAWSHAELSASAGLALPSQGACHLGGPLLFGFCPSGLTPSTTNLVPGSTRQVVTPIEVGAGAGFSGCSALTQYNITYTLRWYPFLGP
jgi:hypothetical protein